MKADTQVQLHLVVLKRFLLCHPRVLLYLRNITLTLCLHRLVKAEANIPRENSGADEGKAKFKIRIFAKGPGGP